MYKVNSKCGPTLITFEHMKLDKPNSVHTFILLKDVLFGIPTNLGPNPPNEESQGRSKF